MGFFRRRLNVQSPALPSSGMARDGIFLFFAHDAADHIHHSFEGVCLGASAPLGARQLRKNPYQPSRLEGYSLREELACEQIVRLIEFLQHIGCKDIEGCIRQIIDRDLR